MKSIALIHTVKGVANTFEEKLRSRIPEAVRIHNLWDDFLADEPNEIGEFTINNRSRLLMDIKSAELTGADIIVTTCSTLTPVVDMIRPFIAVPLIAIDDAMAKKSIEYGSNLLIMATAVSTVEPTKDKIMTEAQKAGIRVTIEQIVLQDAFAAMKALDMEKHDKILCERANEIKKYDCIVLAQASMAHLEAEIETITGCPTLSSPELCIAQVIGTLNGLNNIRKEEQ